MVDPDIFVCHGHVNNFDGYGQQTRMQSTLLQRKAQQNWLCCLGDMVMLPELEKMMLVFGFCLVCMVSGVHLIQPRE